MDKNTELLNYIYQNAEMGKDTISQLMDITEEKEFKELLKCQCNEYKHIFDLADEKLKKVSKEGKNISTLSKISTYITINLKTLNNKTSSHISEMLIQGSTMGIIDATKRIKDYDNSDEEILALAKKLLAFEERSIEEYKKFL